ncbi:ABC transporter permease [Rhodoferax ferrireducens]|uniref:ABC transporter permease n=1 Tax=Rhodoferax ferrireducens TaxID=192843 RepID=UPI000E0DE5C1|nr:ABC transporter permease [Rhodoferax ferrireducens]
MNLLRAIWAFRGFILSSVKREFQSKYRNSLLGATWMIINPLAMIAVYTVIFSQLMRSRLPGVDGAFAYSIYLCAGVLTWGFFSEIVGRAQNVFIENANLIKKLSFPRLCLPIIVVLNAGLNFSIIFALFIVFLVSSGNFPGWVFLGVVPVLLVQAAFSIGLGMTLGVLNVFFRDVGQFFGIVLQFWFWLTPIVYPANVLPEGMRRFLAYNPMALLVDAYQKILVYSQWPDWSRLIPVLVLSLLLCVLGAYLFRKHAGDMVDEL